MFQSINKSQFRDAFHSAGRADQFSYDALGLLFDYLGECDPNAELDVIAICCEYSEATAKTIAESYGIKTEDGENDAEILDALMAYLDAHTTVVGTTDAGAIVYAQF
jgi:DNA-binding PucR family transcriptional regulator